MYSYGNKNVLYKINNTNIILKHWCTKSRSFHLNKYFDTLKILDGATKRELEYTKKRFYGHIVHGNIIHDFITINIDNVDIFTLPILKTNSYFLPDSLADDTFINLLLPEDFKINELDLSVLSVGNCTAGINNNTPYFKKATHIPTRYFRPLPRMTDQEILEHNIQIVDFSYILIELSNIDNDRSQTCVTDTVARYKQVIESIFVHHLKYYYQTKILTLICNFAESGNVAFNIHIKQHNKLRRIIQELNLFLEDIIFDKPNIYMLDYNNLINIVGKRHVVYDAHTGCSPLFHFSVDGFNTLTPHSRHFLNTIYNERFNFKKLFYKYIRYIHRIATQKDIIKLVIFDLDETLFRGFAVDIFKDEKSIQDNVSFFKPTYLLWSKIIHALINRGIMVSISSKNNFELIENNFQKLYRNLPFNKFINPQINYEAKSQNIKKIIQSVNLTPESVLFVDDNSLQREEVKFNVPGIRVIGKDDINNTHFDQLPYIIYTAPELQRNILGSEHKPILSIDNKNSDTNTPFTKSLFLKRLNLEITACQLTQDDNNIHRVVELTNKTNQFNTNKVERQLPDVLNFLKSGSVYYFTATGIVEGVKTDYNIVCVAYIKDNCIQQFLMSCRVLGFDIEVNVIDYLFKVITKTYDDVSALYVVSSLNMPCKDLYIELGFDDVSDVKLNSCTLTEYNEKQLKHSLRAKNGTIYKFYAKTGIKLKKDFDIPVLECLK